MADGGTTDRLARRHADDPAADDGATPRISVVIPVLDAAEWLGHQLAALAAQDVPVPWEVLVADNGSTDETVDVALSWRKDLPLRLVDASERRGINHARNRGSAEARGELLLYCDGDDAVHPGWLAAYWRARDAWDLAGGLVETATLNDDRALALTRQESVRGLSTFGWMQTFMGCNFAVHRAVHEDIDGFDETFVGGCDDIDFAFRAQLAGHRLGFVPDAVVAYRLRDSLRGAARQYYAYGQTRARLYRKFRSRGMPRRSWRHTARTYALTLYHLPQVLTTDGRARWVVQAAFLVGMLTGSVHDHTIYLSE